MKKWMSVLTAALLSAALMAGCAGGAPSGQPSSAAPSAAPSQPAGEDGPGSEASGSEAPAADGTVRVAGLKGPTTMGMVKLMQDIEDDATAGSYEVTMHGTADEITPKLISGELDVAALPANLASVLYSRTEGGVQVAAINTLGVLYVVEAGDTVHSVEDLRGRTIYSTGKGTTPEFALNYILSRNGVDPAADVTIDYRSEATEVAAMMAGEAGALAVLPQPYVTAVGMQNEAARVALSLSDEWDKVSQDSSMVTGVLVVRSAFIDENPEAFSGFLADYQASIEWVNANTAEAAELVAKYGIVEKAPVAEKALPACNIVYIAGEEMKTALSGYLGVLQEQNPEAVGGQLPGDDFYYLG